MSEESVEIGCELRALPDDMQVEAAKVACDYCPSNAPPPEVAAAVIACASPMLTGPFDAALPVITPFHLAVLTSRYWGSSGVKLTVGFLDSAPSDLRNKVVAYANEWGKHANIQFALTSTDPQVRIARNEMAYWSYLGTDILSIPRNQPTMMLGGFTMQTRDSEYMRVVVHEFGHTCLAGDTMIDCPRDLNAHPLGIPIKDLVGQQPLVYAWKGDRIVVRRASCVWLSKKKAKVVRVKLKPGQGLYSKKYLPAQELVGTPDHRVRLVDGTWKPMGELKKGDRLCSMYRSKKGGKWERSAIRWTGGVRVAEHVHVAEQVYGPRPLDCHAHHKNEDMLDQSPDNLEWKDKHLHASDHSRGRIVSEETRAKLASRPPVVWTAEMRRKASESAFNRVRTEKELIELADKASKRFKGKKQSPELVAKRMASMARYYANGGRSGMFGKKATMETRAKQSASLRAYHDKKGANHPVVSVEVLEERIDVYDMTVPDADSFVANGCVVHNCAFPHEHARQEIVSRLDVNKTIAYFERTQGWSAATTRQQVLTPLSEASIRVPGVPPSVADQDSIMCYQLPGSITVDGQPIRGGSKIDEVDGQWANKLYPKAVLPPIEPPAPPPAVEKHRVTLVVGGGFAAIEKVEKV